MVTSQLNVRMSNTLRAEGDAALRSKGYVPTEFVRRMWERLASRGRDLDDLVSLVENGHDVLRDNAMASRSEDSGSIVHACKGEELWSEFVCSVGLPMSGIAKGYEEMSYKDVAAESRLEGLE